MAARVHVAGLHAARDGHALLQKPADDAVDGCHHGLARHGSADGAGLDLVADLDARGEGAVGRGAQDALTSVAADEAGDGRVGQGRAGVVDATQVVAAHGLHGGVHVHLGGEARAHADDHGGHAARGAEVALGQNGVNEDVRMQVGDAGGLRVRHDGHAGGLGGQARDLGVLAQDAADALDGGLAQADGLREADGAPDRRGLRQVAHHDLHAGAVEPESDAGCDVAGAADDDKHFFLPSPADVSVTRAYHVPYLP